MEEYLVSRLWKLLYWALCVGEVLLVIAGIMTELLALFFLAFGSYIASLWLTRKARFCPGCGGTLEGNMMLPGQKESACKACGAKVRWG